MIVVRVELASAISRSRDTDLGTLIIDNIGCRANGRVGDYRVRMYRKGAIERAGGCARAMLANAKPTRDATVLGHRRLAEPVHNLVCKALNAMGYTP